MSDSNLRLFGNLSSYPKEPVEAAVYLYESGFKVIPFLISNDGQEKKPYIRDWKEYTLTLDLVKAKVAKTQAFGIVVPEGTLVVDLDCLKDSGGQPGACKFIGLDNLADMSEELGVRDLDFLETITTNTPSGGMHLWYRVPKHSKLKNSASLLRQGIDIRASRTGLILMPPSKAPNGIAYEFTVIGSTMSAAKIPNWLLTQLKERSKIENRLSKEVLEMVIQDINTPQKARAYLQRCSEEIVDAPSGRRNNTLNAVSYGIYKRVSKGEIGVSLADDTIHTAAMSSGLSDKEISATINSAKRAALLGG